MFNNTHVQKYGPCHAFRAVVENIRGQPTVILVVLVVVVVVVEIVVVVVSSPKDTPPQAPACLTPRPPLFLTNMRQQKTRIGSRKNNGHKNRPSLSVCMVTTAASHVFLVPFLLERGLQPVRAHRQSSGSQ